MRRLTVVAVLLVGLATPARALGGRPVALVTAETSNEVLAVSLGPHGGRVLRRVHLADPLMIAAPLHGPAVVVNPHGTVTLLAWHSLLPVKVFHGFRAPKVAEVAPSGRLAYVTDEQTGQLSVIDLRRREIVDRVFVGLQAHHFAISPDGRRIWVALGEDARTIVRLDTTHPRRPRVVGRFRPRTGAHDVRFAPDGSTVWVTSPTGSGVSGYSTSGRLLWLAGYGRAPGHIAFSGGNGLVSSGYGSSLYKFWWRSPPRAPHVAAAPYGSFNLATYRGFVVTTSLFTGEVSQYRVRDLHRLWTAKVAPAARYVAISLWPPGRTVGRTLSLGRGRVVLRFTLRQPDGALHLWRLDAPVGARVRAFVKGTETFTLGVPSQCRRHGAREVCRALFENNLGAAPGLAWRVRVVKNGGPAARVRVVLGVYPRR